MTLLLITICIFAVFIGLFCSKGDVMEPAAATGLTWTLSALCLATLGGKLPPLSGNLYLCLACWIVCLCAAALIAERFTGKKGIAQTTAQATPNTYVCNIYLALAILFLPVLAVFTYRAITQGTAGNWAADLHAAALGKGGGRTTPFGGIFVVIWMASYILELIRFDGRKKWRLAVSFGCFFLYAAVTMSKLFLLYIFLFGGAILLMRRKITLRQALGGASVLVLLCLLLQFARCLDLGELNKSIHYYVIGNLYAFDTLTPGAAEHFGENTFRIVYALLHKLGLSSIEPVNTFLPWVEEPIPTNTYTALYPFYVDFGLWGVCFFAIFTGAVYGWLYKKATMGSTLHIALYAVALTIIVMQYAADLFFTTLTGNIKLAVLLTVPFVLSEGKAKEIFSKLRGRNTRRKS